MTKPLIETPKPRNTMSNGIASIVKPSDEQKKIVHTLTPKKKINRTSAGLREALFDQLEKLRDGEATADDAGAFARVSNAIIAAARAEMQFAELKHQQKISGFQSIELGENNETLKIGSDHFGGGEVDKEA